MLPSKENLLNQENSKDEKLRLVLEVLINLIRNIQLNRVLGKNNPQINFWRVIYANSMDICINEWNKLFGSEKNHQTHWKNVFEESADRFKEELIKFLEIKEDEFENYRKEMITLRDKLINHFDLSYILEKKIINFPYLDYSLKSSFFYYNKLYEVIENKKIYNLEIDKILVLPEDVEAYAEKIYLDFEDKFNSAFVNHKNLIEKVY